MQKNDVSQLWFRIANLKPKMRDHLSISRQEYRDKIWYVYQDNATNRFHRFDYSAHQFIAMMNGNRSVQDILEILKPKNKHQSFTKDEIFLLIGKLHRADLLQTNTKPDTRELYNRANMLNQQKLKMFLRNPISFRISLFDPEKLLSHALPLVKPLFTLSAFSIWLLILVFASIMTSSYWSELSSKSIEQTLLPENLLLLGILYPFVKLLHELGHAFAVKHWGGEVHEIGVIFILLIPIPYVDASGASAFSHKRQRIIVGAAGIMVELFLACIALFIWLSVEPGLVRTIAFDVMLIAGVSTLFFNGNPLLKYDGYYVFSDAIGITNLGSRSNRYIGYLIQRYLFGIHEALSPAHDLGERYWFFCYSPAAFIYRMVILSVIVLLIADQAFLIGILLGGWILYNQILRPLFKHVNFILTHPKTSHNRPRAILTSFMMATIFSGTLFVLPFPLVTVAQGVIWMPENARIYVGANGFVKKILVESDSMVSKDEKLIVLEDPLKQTQLKILNAKMQDLSAQYNASWSTNRVQNNVIKEQILSVQADIDQATVKSKELVISSPADGKVIIPNFHDMEGQYLEQGDFFAYIVQPSKVSARIVIPQKDIGLLSTVNNINVLFSGNMSETIPASIKRIIPEASHQLPSPALGTTGGGSLSVDPLDKTGLRSIDKVQQIEIELNTENSTHDKEASYIGKRIYVRFDHGTAPLVQQWYKSMQQLLLRRFSV